jgi:hypothetical protein
MATKTIQYHASPTGAKFHASKKIVRGFLGPVGSGKTVACIKELLKVACEQWPNRNGVRKTRFAIIRNTSPELRTTTLNTFRQWVPEELCPITLSPVLMGRMDFPMPDKTRVQVEFIFLALDIEKDVRKLLSLELTGVFINEAREISFSVLKAARERIGRYPSWADDYSPVDLPKGVEHPCKRKFIVMDTNPPDDDHWWYQLAENGHLSGVNEIEFHKEQTASVFDFFHSPPPLIKVSDGSKSTYKPNPKAENIAFLPGGFDYYLDMIPGNTEDHINVMVLGNYGTIRTGKPVYPEYNDDVHCKDLKPLKSLPIALGWDFGLTPTVVIGQLTSLGQVRILAELVGRDTSVRAFARDIVKPFLSKNFAGYEVAFSVGDPSGNNRGEGEGKSALGILNDIYSNNEDGDILTPLKMGFETLAAPTNDITRRLESVKAFLTKMVDAGQPGYLLDRKCQMLRKGKKGRYQFKRLQVAGAVARYHDKPDKDDYSHPADAEQYLCLGFLHGYDSQTDVIQQDYEYATRRHDRDLLGGY